MTGTTLVVSEKSAHIKNNHKSALSIPGIPTVFVGFPPYLHRIRGWGCNNTKTYNTNTIGIGRYRYSCVLVLMGIGIEKYQYCYCYWYWYRMACVVDSVGITSSQISRRNHTGTCTWE